MGFGFDQINYYELAKPLDFVSWDNYPRTGWHLAQEADLQIGQKYTVTSCGRSSRGGSSSQQIPDQHHAPDFGVHADLSGLM